MSKQVVTSGKFSSLEVVDSAKINNELVFVDLAMEGKGLTVSVVQDIVLSSTSTTAPHGIQLLSVGPILSSSTRGSNIVLSGFRNGTSNVSGSVSLGHSTATTPVSIVEAAYDSLADVTKVGFFGQAPAAKATTAVAAGAFVAGTSGIADDSATFGGYTIGQIAQALKDYGLLA